MDYNALLQDHITTLRDELDDVEETPIEELDPYGPVSMSEIISVSGRIELIHREIDGIDETLPSARTEYRALRQNVDELLSKEPYRDQAVYELVARVDHFETKVRNIEKYGGISSTFDMAVWRRDTIALLEDELEMVIDQETQHRLEEIDSLFYQSYEEYIDDILDEFSSIEQPHYPDSFWWRHPSKVAEEVDS